MKVLVVDDESSVRHVIRRFLRLDFDADAIEAPDGAKALELLLSERVHLVMLDLTMPVMDGLETLEAIRRSPAHADLPVLLMTAHADEARVRRAVELGILDLLVKPFTHETLRERVRKALDAPVRPPGPAAARVVEVEPRRPIMVVDQTAEFGEIAASPLRRLGPVEVVRNEFAALSRCLETPHALVLVGAISDLFTPELFARKLRAAPASEDTRLLMAAADAQRAALYDGVVVRSFDAPTFEASLLAALGRTTRARVAIHPDAPGVHAAVDRLRGRLSAILAGDVALLPVRSEVLPNTRWVLSAVELQAGSLAWELRAKVPLEMAQALAGIRHDVPSDRTSEAQAGECVGRLLAEAAGRLREAVGAHGVTLDLLTPRTTITTPLIPRLPPGDPVSLHRWLLASNHGPVVVTLSQFGTEAHQAESAEAGRGPIGAADRGTGA
ncbi:MAG: response regulator [Vicinamibacterales bacterium]